MTRLEGGVVVSDEDYAAYDAAYGYCGVPMGWMTPCAARSVEANAYRGCWAQVDDCPDCSTVHGCGLKVEHADLGLCEAHIREMRDA